MREPVFTYAGQPVRLAARRPGGLVLVEFMTAQQHTPLGAFREIDPRRITSAKITDTHLQQLIKVLPEVSFVNDATTAASGEFWWTKI